MIKFLRSTIYTPLIFKALDLSSAKFSLVSDASFANSRDLRIQLGYIIILSDAAVNASIVHYGSTRFRRIVHCVRASEVHALVLGFDYTYIVLHLISELLGRTVEV